MYLKNFISNYYFALIYPFRFLFKYGNIPRAKMLVPIFTCGYLFLFYLLITNTLTLSSITFVLFLIVIILLYGIFDVLIFLNEETGVEQIINLPKEIRTASNFFYFLLFFLLTIFIVRERNIFLYLI